VHRRELPQPVRRGAVPRHRPRSRDVGQRLPAPRGVLALQPRVTATHVRRVERGRPAPGARGHCRVGVRVRPRPARAHRRRGGADRRRGGHAIGRDPGRGHEPVVPSHLRRPGTMPRTGSSVGPMLFINGEWRKAASGATFDSRNPATGEVIGQAADAGVADVRDAVEAAAAAFAGWSARTAYERSAYLAQAHQLMLERREALAKLMTEEQGKPIRMARNEVGYAADFLLWFAE